MNTCKRLSASFSDFVENTMLPEQRRVLEAHLSVCAGCRNDIAQLQSLRASLNRLPRLQTPPDFEAILRARLRREAKRAAAPAFTLRLPLLLPRFAVLALGGMALIASVNFLLQSRPAAKSQTAVFSFDQTLPPRFDHTASAVTQFTAPILYTLDRLSPKQWPMAKYRQEEHGVFPPDSLSVNPSELPHGPQNSRASLFSL